MNKRQLLLAAMALPFASLPARAAKPEIYTGLVRGVAVGGYDPVSYFRAGAPQKGSDTFATKWQGATWRFSNAANLAAFQKNPGAYAPQYGGYCAYAVAKGYTAKGDPLAWSIAGGKLYLNYSASVRETWKQDISGNIANGNRNWPDVLR